ncbi:MAG: L-glutamate gamma-semialdehyde dehydrogenase [Pseudobdellovibrionaceae bacterium]
MTKIALPPRNTTETDDVNALIAGLGWDDTFLGQTENRARVLIDTLRQKSSATTEIEGFLERYPLASNEGRALMTLAEALLRIPDGETADALIAEKFASADWAGSDAASGTLSKLITAGISLAKGSTTGFIGGLLGGVSKPIVRKAVGEAIRQLGGQFVVGETIEDALKKSKSFENDGYRMSFDMLGEGARTWDDANRYLESYIAAAHHTGQTNDARLAGKETHERHGISVKLSALHPKYNWMNSERCIPEITERLLHLTLICAQKNITMTVDAEESERLEISLDIISQVLRDKALDGYTGFGLAVQAYDRRAGDVIDVISNTAHEQNRFVQVRLVKGAYWDSEIKRAQNAGWPSYPLYTRKSHTDVSYLRNAAKLLSLKDHIRPMFATHNPQTAASILEMAGKDTKGFEFQRLHGMGESLGDVLRQLESLPVTIYAPVGSYKDLLAYLVRRMLENGANTSFASKLRDKGQSPAKLGESPVRRIKTNGATAPSALPLPPDLYGSHRKNARGFDLSRDHLRASFFADIPQTLPAVSTQTWDVDDLFDKAKDGYKHWSRLPAAERSGILRKAADLYEAHTAELMAFLQYEGQKTWSDALGEIREAVDFLRYYAAEGENLFKSEGLLLNGPTGEENRLFHAPRGTFLCISPWNFPLAIFTGQVAAALMAGNAVIAKPAEQTPAIAHFAQGLMYQAGVSQNAFLVSAGDGAWGAKLVQHKDVAGVAFTGSTVAAQSINRALAAKNGPIVPLVAETGGQNAMIVDSTALLEQTLDDVLLSAFGSAGQRCSALRVLYLQNDIAPHFLKLLKGGIEILQTGSPLDPANDVPPIIDKEAYDALIAHKNKLDKVATKIAEGIPPTNGDNKFYIPPCVYEIRSIKELAGEVFGPILHVIRFESGHLDQVITDIHETGYGLTFGLQSRLTGRIAEIAEKITAGNIYLNRSMIGAVVGVQPFGGQGLSGTGPKAGGPHYLPRFATERVVSSNIMALGGNVNLLTRTDLE